MERKRIDFGSSMVHEMDIIKKIYSATAALKTRQKRTLKY